MSKLMHTVAGLAVALTGAKLPAADLDQIRQGGGALTEAQYRQNWQLGKGQTINGVTDILTGPTMAFYVDHAKKVTEMFNSQGYKDFIAAHPGLKVSNPFESQDVKTILERFQSLASKDPKVVTSNLSAWDNNCEKVADANALYLAHYINIRQTEAGIPLTNFGSDPKAIRGSKEHNWMDGKMHHFIISDGDKFPDIKQSYVLMCRAQAAQLTQKIPLPHFDPNTPVEITHIPTVSIPDRNPLKKGEFAEVAKHPTTTGDKWSGFKPSSNRSFNLIPAVFGSSSGGGRNTICPIGCPGSGGL